MPRPLTLTPDILQAALSGLEAQRERIDGQISELRRLLGTNQATVAKRPMSAAGRARIAAAQRKRWAEAKGTASAAKPEKRKRKLSAAGRKAIADAAKRRWAALRASKAAAK
jgi:hypothetical protein